MATLYAQSTGNWDAINWNTAANGSGSNQTPGASDSLVSNSYTVTVNGSYTVTQVTNTSGGTFTLANGSTLTCTHATDGVVGAYANVGAVTSALTAGQSATLNAHIKGGGSASYTGVICSGAGGTLTIVGNVTGGSGNPSHGVHVSAVHNVNITGNILGGNTANARGVYLAAATNITVVGNVSGQSSPTSGYGIDFVAGSTASITGNVTGGSGAGTAGVFNSQASTISMTGNLSGGTSTAPGINNTSASLSASIVGDIIASSTASGLQNNQICSITHDGNLIDYVTNSGSQIAVSAAYSLGGIRRASGFSPAYRETANYDCSGTVKFFTANHADSTSNMPVIANVRYGTTYGPSNEYTGTCRIPAASSVAYGALVDATTGTAVLTQEAASAVMGAIWAQG